MQGEEDNSNFCWHSCNKW